MRHPARFERAALGLALALAAGDSLAADRIPLAEEHRQAITSTRIVANLAQEEMSAAARVIPWFPRGSSLAARIAASIVDDARAADARAGAQKLEEALGAFDPRPRMKAALERELGQVALFQGASVEVRHEGALDGAAAGALVARGGADAVLVVDVQYGFSEENEFLVVSGRATLLPTAAAAAPALRKALGASTRELPVTPLYRAVVMTSMRAPEEGDELDRWLPERAAPARRAIEGGIEELARMLAWDLGEGAPPVRGLFASAYPVPRDRRVVLPQFGEDFEAAPARTEGERIWYRASEGELVSSGDTYAEVALTPMSAFPLPKEAAPTAPVPLTRDAAGRLTVGFASADATLQGGAITVTQYSERPGDVELQKKRFEDGVLVVTGQVGRRKGSGYAGLGPRWLLQQGGAPVDARAFQSVTVRLGSTTRALRVRLSGTVPPGGDDACHPVYVVEDVEESVKEYTIPLSRFAPEGWCKAKGREVKEVLPELTAIEVVSNRITERPLTLRVGATTFNP